MNHGAHNGAAAGPAAASPLPDWVVNWAQLPGASALLASARKKLEGGGTGDRIKLAVLDKHRSDVSRLLGLSWDATGNPATLGLLRTKLANHDVDLIALLVAIDGPLRNKPAENRQAASARRQLRADTIDRLHAAGIPRPVAELAVARRWLGSNLRTATDALTTVWRALPNPPGGDKRRVGTAGLAELAGQELLDPHALDRDKPVGRAAARLLAATLAFLDEESDGVPARPDHHRVATAISAAKSVLRARPWRATWESAGVVCDQVSSTVLVLNLPLEGPNAALSKLTEISGEPIWLTARMTREGCRLSNGRRSEVALVRVFENPSVIEAAADRLGANCPPLVCLYGRPSAAAWEVLSAIADTATPILLSTDRDKAGEQIAAEIIAELERSHGPGAVTPWLPSVAGTFEEERLRAMLSDLAHSDV